MSANLKKCLTIVLPSFNEQKTIREIISRVLLQDFVNELIIINDASTDRTLEDINGG
jgi:glycosyltransferase involved in cell wall biosynthesis